MEYSADEGDQWPRFVSQAIAGAAGLHVADSDVEGGAWRVIAEGLLGSGEYLAIFLTVENDTARSRLSRFWMRNAALAQRGRTWEQWHSRDGELARVAILEVRESRDIRESLFSTVVPFRQRVLIAPGPGMDIDAFAKSLAEDPALSSPHFRPWGLVPWLLRGGLTREAVVIRPEDSLDGRPGLAFYGYEEKVAGLWDSVTTLIARGQ